ncbi:hypothetical protein [Stackebrandtia soli]|uniref:hypothetical protein n=1 Tax=Stackebrandtia soli TaxID=1892856 RepID=UPI0039E9B02E
MPELRCEAVRWIADEPFPGLIEVQFIDADGRTWSLVDKAAIFGAAEDLEPDSNYPAAVTVACVLRGADEQVGNDGGVTISTSPDGVTSPDGRDTFTVTRDRIIP